jgi:hypothetical protein
MKTIDMNLPTINRLKAVHLMEQSKLAMLVEQFNTLLASHQRVKAEVESLRQTLSSYVGSTQKLTEEIAQYKRNKRPR